MCADSNCLMGRDVAEDDQSRYASIVNRQSVQTLIRGMGGRRYV